ncbi:uncharacterized protein DUF930 [Aminobacter sp. AP02]|nr:uncharacterized protein DUF930 [Aminobacter sp. AP02]
MADETSNRHRDSQWAFPTSLVVHALLITVLLAYSQPRVAQQQEEQAINVTLAPPPEQPKSEPAPPPAPEAPKAEKEPEPKQALSETQPPKPAQIEVLKPVFRFGDKDAGPDKPQEGSGVQSHSPSPEKNNDPKPTSEKQPDAASDGEKQATAEAEPAQSAKNEAASNQDIGKQEADKTEGLVDGTDKLAAVVPTPLGAAGTDGEIALPALATAPQPRPDNAPKSGLAEKSKPGNEGAKGPKSKNVDIAASQPYPGLPGVRRPQSQGATGDVLATTSMAGVPRDRRAAKLCASALQQQLLDSSYAPDLVPLVPLKLGNVLDVPEAAFRTRTAWHALSFRCEVDTDATIILSLSFRVGATIPRDQWARLGLPTGN